VLLWIESRCRVTPLATWRGTDPRQHGSVPRSPREDVTRGQVIGWMVAGQQTLTLQEQLDRLCQMDGQLLQPREPTRALVGVHSQPNRWGTQHLAERHVCVHSPGILLLLPTFVFPLLWSHDQHWQPGGTKNALSDAAEHPAL